MALAPVTRSGSRLLVGGVATRFSGMNAYWLGLDDNAGVNFPSHTTITNAIAGMVAMGANLARAHTVGISAGTSMSYLTGYSGTTPQYVEANMDSADWAVSEAGRLGLYLLIPLTDNWNYYHGGLWNYVHWAYQQNSSGFTADVNEGYTGGTGKDDKNQRVFFANTAPGLRVRALFKDYISHLLNHVNPYTGLAYKDDPTIAFVETGNELYFSAQLGNADPVAPDPGWVQDICSYVKSIAPGKLLIDGGASSGTAAANTQGLTAAACDGVDVHYYPATPSYSGPVTFGNTSSNFGSNSALQQLAADTAAVTGAGKVMLNGEYPWTRSDVAAWYSALQQNPAISGDLMWAFIAGTEGHGGGVGSDDYPLHYPYLGGTEQSLAPALAAHIAAMTAPAARGRVTRTRSGTNIATAVPRGRVTAVRSRTISSRRGRLARVRSAAVTSGAAPSRTVRPYERVDLGPGNWTQTGGPTVSTPIFTAPALQFGTLLSFANGGDVTTVQVKPHTMFRITTGGLVPSRTLTLGVDSQDTVSLMPTGDIVANGHTWQQIFAEDFLTDVPLGGFTPKANSPGAGSLVTGAAATAYGGRLTVYPSGYGASSNGKSRPEKVLSVANSCLVYSFSVDATTGEAMAATVHYMIGGNTYGGGTPGYYIDPTVGGRFEIRFRVVNGPSLTGWGGVAQLIANDADWSAMHGELDFVEGSLSQNMETNQHWYGAPNVFTRWGTQPYGNVWHKAVVEWVPVGNATEPNGREIVWIDDVKIGESLGDRIAQNNRALIAFQTGVNSVPPAADGATYPADGQTRGQLLIDYVVAYRPTN